MGGLRGSSGAHGASKRLLGLGPRGPAPSTSAPRSQRGRRRKRAPGSGVGRTRASGLLSPGLPGTESGEVGRPADGRPESGWERAEPAPTLTGGPGRARPFATGTVAGPKSPGSGDEAGSGPPRTNSVAGSPGGEPAPHAASTVSAAARSVGGRAETDSRRGEEPMRTNASSGATVVAATGPTRWGPASRVGQPIADDLGIWGTADDVDGARSGWHAAPAGARVMPRRTTSASSGGTSDGTGARRRQCVRPRCVRAREAGGAMTTSPTALPSTVTTAATARLTRPLRGGTRAWVWGTSSPSVAGARRTCRAAVRSLRKRSPMDGSAGSADQPPRRAVPALVRACVTCAWWF